jgi:hypothetical protein
MLCKTYYSVHFKCDNVISDERARFSGEDRGKQEKKDISKTMKPIARNDFFGGC